jgi:F0F1-type ATP synthase assembly protein I
MSEDSSGPNKFARYTEISQIGLEMVAPIGLGLGLDYWMSWGPWGAIVGAILGLVGGMGHLVVILNAKAAQDPSKNQRGKP